MGALALVLLGLVGYSPSVRLDQQTKNVAIRDDTSVTFHQKFVDGGVIIQNGQDAANFIVGNVSLFPDIAGDVIGETSVDFDDSESWGEYAHENDIYTPLSSLKNVVDIELDSMPAHDAPLHTAAALDDKDSHAAGSAWTVRDALTASWTQLDQVSSFVLSYALGLPTIRVGGALAFPTGHRPDDPKALGPRKDYVPPPRRKPPFNIYDPFKPVRYFLANWRVIFLKWIGHHLQLSHMIASPADASRTRAPRPTVVTHAIKLVLESPRAQEDVMKLAAQQEAIDQMQQAARMIEAVAQEGIPHVESMLDAYRKYLGYRYPHIWSRANEETSDLWRTMRIMALGFFNVCALGFDAAVELVQESWKVGLGPDFASRASVFIESFFVCFILAVVSALLSLLLLLVWRRYRSADSARTADVEHQAVVNNDSRSDELQGQKTKSSAPQHDSRPSQNVNENIGDIESSAAELSSEASVSFALDDVDTPAPTKAFARHSTPLLYTPLPGRRGIGRPAFSPAYRHRLGRAAKPIKAKIRQQSPTRLASKRTQTERFRENSDPKAVAKVDGFSNEQLNDNTDLSAFFAVSGHGRLALQGAAAQAQMRTARSSIGIQARAERNQIDTGAQIDLQPRLKDAGTQCDQRLVQMTSKGVQTRELIEEILSGSAEALAKVRPLYTSRGCQTEPTMLECGCGDSARSEIVPSKNAAAAQGQPHEECSGGRQTPGTGHKTGNIRPHARRFAQTAQEPTGEADDTTTSVIELSPAESLWKVPRSLDGGRIPLPIQVIDDSSSESGSDSDAEDDVAYPTFEDDDDVNQLVTRLKSWPVHPAEPSRCANAADHPTEIDEHGPSGKPLEATELAILPSASEDIAVEAVETPTEDILENAASSTSAAVTNASEGAKDIERANTDRVPPLAAVSGEALEIEQEKSDLAKTLDRVTQVTESQADGSSNAQACVEALLPVAAVTAPVNDGVLETKNNAEVELAQLAEATAISSKVLDCVVHDPASVSACPVEPPPLACAASAESAAIEPTRHEPASESPILVVSSHPSAHAAPAVNEPASLGQAAAHLPSTPPDVIEGDMLHATDPPIVLSCASQGTLEPLKESLEQSISGAEADDVTMAQCQRDETPQEDAAVTALLELHQAPVLFGVEKPDSVADSLFHMDPAPIMQIEHDQSGQEDGVVAALLELRQAPVLLDVESPDSVSANLFHTDPAPILQIEHNQASQEDTVFAALLELHQAPDFFAGDEPKVVPKIDVLVSPTESPTPGSHQANTGAAVETSSPVSTPCAMELTSCNDEVLSSTSTDQASDASAIQGVEKTSSVEEKLSGPVQGSSAHAELPSSDTCTSPKDLPSIPVSAVDQAPKLLAKTDPTPETIAVQRSATEGKASKVTLQDAIKVTEDVSPERRPKRRMPASIYQSLDTGLLSPAPSDVAVKPANEPPSQPTQPVEPVQPKLLTETTSLAASPHGGQSTAWLPAVPSDRWNSPDEVCGHFYSYDVLPDDSCYRLRQGLTPQALGLRPCPLPTYLPPNAISYEITERFPNSGIVDFRIDIYMRRDDPVFEKTIGIWNRSDQATDVSKGYRIPLLDELGSPYASRGGAGEGPPPDPHDSASDDGMAMSDDALSDEDAELERQLSMMPKVEAPARPPAHGEAALPRNTVEPSRKLVNRSLGLADLWPAGASALGQAGTKFQPGARSVTKENSPSSDIKWPKRRPNRQHLRPRPQTGTQSMHEKPDATTDLGIETSPPSTLQSSIASPKMPADSSRIAFDFTKQPGLPSSSAADSSSKPSTFSAGAVDEPAPGTGKHYRRNQLKRQKAAAKKKAAREGCEGDDSLDAEVRGLVAGDSAEPLQKGNKCQLVTSAAGPPA